MKQQILTWSLDSSKSLYGTIREAVSEGREIISCVVLSYDDRMRAESAVIITK